ncbi:MAG: hypothetical protein NVSMB18_03010 [Acetobacteraceae bacterium]
MDEYGILDTPPEPGFDDVVFLASQICAAPVALVSLVGRDRQWFKARLGLATSETSIGGSICAYALNGDDLFVIDDLATDPRTRNNDLVTGAPKFRFYAGAPLVSAKGVSFGTVCVLDTSPRPGGLRADQRLALQALARQVVYLLETRRVVDRRDQQLVEARQHEAETHRTLLGDVDRTEAEALRTAALIELADALQDAATVPVAIEATLGVLSRTLPIARAGYATVQTSDGFFRVEHDWVAPGVASIAGHHPTAPFPATLARLEQDATVIVADTWRTDWLEPDRAGYEASGARAAIMVPSLSRGRLAAFLFVHDSQPRAWSDAEISFVGGVADRAMAAIDRLQAEQQQHTVTRELAHRLKNILAMVQALASQSLRHVPDQEPVHAFRQRLLALSRAHDVLLQDSWEGAAIADVAGAALEATGQDARCEVSGPPLVLGARVALSFSLVLYELATNAVKYGALSNESGRVTVRWRIERGGQEAMLVFEWRESGGPAVTPPDRRGFGSRLIGLGLVGAGNVVVRYEPAGFEADMRAPLARAQQG